MNRYIREESRTPNGQVVPIRIIYFGTTLDSLTFAQIVEDRQSVFGKNWVNCLPSGNAETLIYTISKSAHKRHFKGELT